jgi:hypothetical protein
MKHDLHVFSAWKMFLLLTGQTVDELQSCSGCDGEEKNPSDFVWKQILTIYSASSYSFNISTLYLFSNVLLLSV